MKYWFAVMINPEPWAVGPLSVARSGKGVYPKMGRNEKLATYQEALASAIVEEYPNLFLVKDSKTGLPLASLFGKKEVELTFHLWQKIEVSEVTDGRTRSGVRKSRNHLADLTNMVKAAEDAVAKILFDNDVQVRAQRNVIMDRGTHVPEGVVVISIEEFIAPDPDELPSFVWEKIEVIFASEPQPDLFS